jgi:hypothetical protein
MERGKQKEHWIELYKEAISENDAERLGTRISEAQNAIQVRARQLWAEGSQEATERERLQAAYQYLEILHSLARQRGQPCQRATRRFVK